MSKEKETVLSVEGMTCASCVRHVERALAALKGVDHVLVTLAPGKAVVTHESDLPTIDEMIKAVDEAGYSASSSV